MAKPREEIARPAEFSAVFDRPHLARYTMDNADLEKEIIGLFLQQLPSIVTMLEEADSPEAWKLAAHTLKGSAAAVGARAIHESAVDLERIDVYVNVKIRLSLLAGLRARVDRFQAVIRTVYP